MGRSSPASLSNYGLLLIQQYIQMHTLFNSIYVYNDIKIYMNYYIANRWEVEEAVFGSPQGGI